MEDYIFEKQEEEQQRKRLMNTLMEKNKGNSEQIQVFYKKCEKVDLTNLLPNPSSDEGSMYRN